jgi:hypothetical protein
MRVLILLCSLAVSIPCVASPRKLIEFGWDEPGADFLRAHIQEMQQTPFDGCVFHVDYKKPNGNKGSFTWQAWGTELFTQADLKDAMADLRATRFGRFQDNFLRFNTTPAKLDWFDDYGAVIANAKLAAQVARASRCPGILFDIEQYEAPLFDFRKQRDAQNKSWELYAAQVRRRGREVMRAFQDGFPGLTVFLTFGYSLPWAETAGGKKSLADCKYGLLAPFLDGMVEAAAGRARLVDGYERAYGYKTDVEFVRARESTWNDLLPLVQDPQKYKRTFSLGFGIWLDRDWRKLGWNTDDLARNYFSPESFRASVEEALKNADQYVWIYSETPRWWSADGKPVKLPVPYQEALREARKTSARSR